MRHVLSALVQNIPGVLSHISGMLASRGYNIDSLAVGETEDPKTSRMTIVVEADEKILEQVKKQLNKLIDTIRVQDFTHGKYVDKELILIKVKAENKKTREKIVQIVDSTGAEVIDIGKKFLMIEETGDEHKIKALIELLRPYGILEIARTGKIALQSDI